MTILARPCYSTTPHPWHIWDVGSRRFLCTGRIAR